MRSPLTQRPRKVYHSAVPSDGEPHACGCALLPLNTKTRGPAKRTEGEDIVDEAIAYFRANVLFRKYDVKGSSDKLLIYLTLYISACLRKLEAAPSLAAGQKAVFNLAMEPFALPGDAGWPLGGLFTTAATRDEADSLRAYLKQAREETGARLVVKCYTEEGKPNKFWMAFSRRKFMNKELS